MKRIASAAQLVAFFLVLLIATVVIVLMVSPGGVYRPDPTIVVIAAPSYAVTPIMEATRTP